MVRPHSPAGCRHGSVPAWAFSLWHPAPPSYPPAGNSVFFNVKRIEDPIGLLPGAPPHPLPAASLEYLLRPACACRLSPGAPAAPAAKLILGINKRGVHFFRPVPKEYLHSAELRDIMQFGSSSTAVGVRAAGC